MIKNDAPRCVRSSAGGGAPHIKKVRLSTTQAIILVIYVDQFFFRPFMLAMLDWANIDTLLMKCKVVGAILKEVEKQI